MSHYDTNIHPPAPLAFVLVSHPFDREKNRQLQGKLDTGADLSVIPESLPNELQLIPAREIVIRSYDGTVQHKPGYFVALEVEGQPVQLVEAIAAKRTNMLLGRDVLNRFRLTLDGKALTWDIEDP
ncbi:MAG: retropepsin-like aspartic protease [Anaerolineae bacterium]